MRDAEASLVPPPEISLSDQAKANLLAAAEIIVAEVSAAYRDGLTRQVALLYAENQELREEVLALKAEKSQSAGRI